MTTNSARRVPTLRSRLAAVRDAFHGVLHPLRRAKARARLRRAAPVESVVFACLGNVCRSPYAAASLRKLLGNDDTRVDSVGFMAEDRAPPDVAISVARERGVDQSDHRSRAASLDELKNASVIFVFDAENIRRLRRIGYGSWGRVIHLGDLDPIWPGKRPIWDPWDRPVEDFRTVFERIDRCLDALVAQLDAESTDLP